MKISKNWISITLVIFLNFWIWKIFQLNIPIFFLVIFLTCLLYKIVIEESFKYSYILIIVLTIFIFTYLIKDGMLDITIFSNSETETFSINERRKLYPSFGKLIQNKITTNFYKMEKNFFNNLDLNLYFFASHPRERSGVEEFEKFPSVFIIFFAIGIFSLINKLNTSFIIYLIIISMFSVVLKQTSIYGPIFFFPIVVIIITEGLLRVIKEMNFK